MSSQNPGSVTWCAKKGQTVAHRDEVLFITVVSHISSRSVRQILAESSWPPSWPWKQLSQGHVPWCSQGLTSLEVSFSTSWRQTWYFPVTGDLSVVTISPRWHGADSPFPFHMYNPLVVPTPSSAMGTTSHPKLAANKGPQQGQILQIKTKAKKQRTPQPFLMSFLAELRALSSRSTSSLVFLCWQGIYDSPSCCPIIPLSFNSD